MKLIYENISREPIFDKLIHGFDDVYRVRNWNEDVPHEGFFIGSIAGCNWMRANRPNVRHASSFENYTCSAYYPKMQDLLFNDKYAFIPFKDLSRRKWCLYSWLGKESLLFIRPDSGEKDIPAGLVDLQDIDKLVSNYDYDGLAVVSTPKNMVGEWRFVVTNDKVIHAVSSYRYQGVSTQVPSAPQQAYDCIKKVLDIGYFPDKIFCVDVVQDQSGDCWVMELTSFSSAGLYACNPSAIVNVIKNYGV